jgi:hypothetical protein
VSRGKSGFDRQCGGTSSLPHAPLDFFIIASVELSEAGSVPLFGVLHRQYQSQSDQGERVGAPKLQACNVHRERKKVLQRTNARERFGA